ncbi:hypothetical protein [Nocardia abscessus]|uniref:hypothetical protein n=1 Tax=Nocardia abscessus TaxID=120957 RepID=UPI0002D8EE43|nr:hypothetical protein [Nocardia abscessus]MCC3330203.1 hypothetical protein [Nocardia abscessus]
MGYLPLVVFAIGVVAAVLGVVIVRRNKARGRSGEDTTTRARAAGAQLSKEARGRQWRKGKSNDYSAGGGGYGGGGGCAGGE